MNWPDDNLPRFRVQTVTGYRIDPRAFSYSSGYRVPPIVVYVLDRAYCDRVVASFPTGRRSSRTAFIDAIAYAAQLNEREAGRAA